VVALRAVARCGRGRPQHGRDRPMSRINVMLPYLGQDEIDAVSEVISSGWVAQGPRVAAFESAFAEAQQIPYAVAT